jgi:hypothetical protein
MDNEIDDASSDLLIKMKMTSCERLYLDHVSFLLTTTTTTTTTSGNTFWIPNNQKALWRSSIISCGCITEKQIKMVLSSKLFHLLYAAVVVSCACVVDAFTLAPPSRQVPTILWNAASDSKKAVEVVEDYRDNLKNSRTAPGHHDGNEKKVSNICLKPYPSDETIPNTCLIHTSLFSFSEYQCRYEIWWLFLSEL